MPRGEAGGGGRGEGGGLDAAKWGDSVPPPPPPPPLSGDRLGEVVVDREGELVRVARTEGMKEGSELPLANIPPGVPVAPVNGESVLVVEGLGLELTLTDAPKDPPLDKEGVPDMELDLEGEELRDLAPLGDLDVVRKEDAVKEGALVGVGQAEGFTDSPVVPQAAGQVQGMGTVAPAGQ